MGRTTVIKAVKALVDAGLIYMMRRPYKSNVYKLLNPPDEQGETNTKIDTDVH